MKLLWVRMANFLSYGAPAQMVELDSRGLIAVLGKNDDSQGADSNGAGKSSVMEAIVWALYGETMRGYRGDAVVNRTNGEDCCVSLSLQDGETNYLVRRWRKRRAKKPNDLELVVNGRCVSQGTMADTQALVTTLVGMDFSTFTQSVMMWHGTRPFSAMTDREQKSVLEDILQIDQLSRAKDVVKRRISAGQQALTAAQSESAMVGRQIQDTTATLGKLRTQQQQHSTLVAQRRRQLQRKKADCEGRIEEVYTNTGLDKLLALQENLREKEAQLGKRRNHVQTQRLEATRKYAHQRAQLARVEGAAQGQIAQFQQAIETLDSLVGKPCPTCHQVLPLEAAESSADLWERETKRLRSETLVQTGTSLAKLEKAERTELARLDADEAATSTEWEALTAQSQNTAEAVRKRQASLALICQLEQQAWAFQQEIEQLSEEADPYSSLIADATAQLAAARKELRRVNYQVRSLGIELEHLVYWNHGFGNRGLKSYLMDNVVPFLTERAQSYADVLSGGDLKIEFSTQSQLANGEWRDKFQVSAINEQGADVYHGNSDGERRRIDIAVGWALADLAATRAKKSIRFRGLDEPFEHLDETGEDLVIKLLHKVLPQYETILCVTHSTHLRDQFPEEIMVTFENGFSKIS
jgi:DNA repair exonuclease SbcCD ATPase subunit